MPGARGRTRAVSATSCPVQPRPHRPAGSRTPRGGDGTGCSRHSGDAGPLPVGATRPAPGVSASRVSLFLPDAPRSPAAPAAWSRRRETDRCPSRRDRRHQLCRSVGGGRLGRAGVPRTPAPLTGAMRWHRRRSRLPLPCVASPAGVGRMLRSRCALLVPGLCEEQSRGSRRSPPVCSFTDSSAACSCRLAAAHT